MEAEQFLERFRNTSRLMQNDLQSLEKAIGRIKSDDSDLESAKELVSTVIENWEEFTQWILLSSLDSNEIHQLYSPGHMDIKGKIAKSVKRRKREADRGNIKFNTSKVQDITVFSYIPCVESIIMLLVQNATKYATKQTEVSISNRIVGDCCEISIASLGPLIEQHEIRRLGEKGFRGKNAILTQKPGSGFGLSSVKRICETINATVTYKSENLITHYNGVPMSYFTATVRMPLDITDFLKRSE